VHAFLFSNLTTLTNFSLKLPPVFFWGMQVNTRDMFVVHFEIIKVL